VNVLLDSHALLWYLLDDEQLPESMFDLLEDRTTRVAVSVASQWELMTKVLAGRLRLPTDPGSFLVDVPLEAGFRLIDVQPRHVALLPELPQIHRDPFDRMLVAQALAEDLDLVTGDETLRSYPVRTLW
jgi:PIN domain nuclease of toxin-antitoxin system